MWKDTAARKMMRLTRVEREKITDTVLKIQSARASLEEFDEQKLPEIAEMQDCLDDADKSLRQALRSTAPKQTPE